MILGPWICESVYCFVRKEEYERDWTNFLILPFLVSRMVHNQVWISFSRYRTAKGNNRIVDKGIEFDQVDRENNWDDQIILSGILLYVFNTLTYGASNLALWRSDGVLISIFLHAGPVEFLYYWQFTEHCTIIISILSIILIITLPLLPSPSHVRIVF